MNQSLDLDKTIEYAVAYLHIEKKNLENLISETATSANMELIQKSRERLTKVDEELLAYRRLLNDTIQFQAKNLFK
ncbi:hypothetical protein I6N95_01615 [Vagococcus sp. BWB3-3]|uniref:Uncharacterized protein n=1 Tax=Vagococcus allomyrinae TaxID=2794353 RepID=A0A940PA72_9ENTE|nr:hypothetical protein [Vagococcus allomyrinae]MBP1039696.1 hypothetical protein [Vagococcus allomyrinae]